MSSDLTTDDLSTEPSVEGFAETVMAAAIGAQLMQAMYLGDRLGWYQALADEGPLTGLELARRTGTNPRYAREWLEYQAVCGIVSCQPGIEDDELRAYRLPPAHSEVLVNADSLAYLSPLARMSAASGRRIDDLLAAYRNGGGVSWADLGPDAREAQASINRPLFLQQLSQELLPAVPDLDQRLRAGARVADVGCGEGWSSIGLALGYPEIQVDGLDVDEPSIAAARRHAAAHEVEDRVHFVLGDASTDSASSGVAGYDAVFAFECLHDVPDPVGFLATMRRLAAPGAPVIVMDERTAPRFDPAAGPIEQLLYGFSVTICLPDGMAHETSAATGTVMRPATLETYARAAGFDRVQELPIPHEMFRFYRLH